MSDIISDAREWLATQGDRVQTHSDKCHLWHPSCLVSRLLRELSRTGLQNANNGDFDASDPERDICGRLRREIAWEPEVGELLAEAAGEIERLRGYRDEAEAEASIAGLAIDRLREAIRRLADQDATLSVVGGNVTVTMDATLTDAEREAIRFAAVVYQQGGRDDDAATLRGLLERTGPDRIGKTTKNAESPIGDGSTLDGDKCQ